MLGSLIRPWEWAAGGKHPAAGDFFELGSLTPMLKAFLDWMERGYREFSSGEKASSGKINGFRSWRFWAKGSRPNHLVIGLVKDSCDSLGRPFPFLIAGSGPLKKWNKYWSFFPDFFENIWSRMEYLGSGRYQDLRELDEEFSSIQPPDEGELKIAFKHWEINKSSQKDSSRIQMIPDLQNLASLARQMVKNPESFIPLDPGVEKNSMIHAGLWHQAIKDCAGPVPGAVFMGGNLDKSYMAIFNRPLSSMDFTRLWEPGY